MAANYQPGMVVTFNLGTARHSGREERCGGACGAGTSFTSTVRRNPLPPGTMPAKSLDLRVPPFHGSLGGGPHPHLTQPSSLSGVVNGDVLTVSRINSDLTINTREGPILPAGFRDFCHGYVVTSHKAQGRTHQSVILAAAEVDAKAAYVACSRGRERCSIFLPDMEHFLRGLPRSGDRTAALDLAAQPKQASPSIMPATVSELVGLGQGEGAHVSVPVSGRSLLAAKDSRTGAHSPDDKSRFRSGSFERRLPVKSGNSVSEAVRVPYLKREGSTKGAFFVSHNGDRRWLPDGWLSRSWCGGKSARRGS